MVTMPVKPYVVIPAVLRRRCGLWLAPGYCWPYSWVRKG
jgi:hypothetical protein